MHRLRYESGHEKRVRGTHQLGSTKRPRVNTERVQASEQRVPTSWRRHRTGKVMIWEGRKPESKAHSLSREHGARDRVREKERTSELSLTS